MPDLVHDVWQRGSRLDQKADVCAPERMRADGWQLEFPTDARCPCHVPDHLADGYAAMCARLWWQEPLPGAQHRLALFASFPIPQIEVVTDRAAGKHVATKNTASRAGVPVVEVER